MKTALILFICVTAVAAHCSMWHPSTFDADRQNGNSDRNSQPLQDMTFKQWWWRGLLDHPPTDGSVFSLPANGVAVAEISSNKAFTSMGARKMIQPNTPEPWTGNSWSNIHAVNRNDVAGCAFGIAYKSDQHAVKPEDFVIFSVVHDCIARQNQTFHVPNLPACPNNKCMCSWFWIHKSIGGSDQMYMSPFVCNVINARANARPVDVARAQPPRKCRNPTRCTQGPRNPMYWKNLEGNNMPEQGHYAPTYSILYGFAEGAQHDIFVNTNPVPKKVKPLPAAKMCTDNSINPKKFQSRLVSGTGNDSLIDGGDYGLVSPNCQYSAWLEWGTGSLMLKNNKENNVPWFGPATQRNQRPYKLQMNKDGTLSTTNAQGTAVWTAPMTTNVGKPPYRLELTNDGQLVIFDGFGLNRWENFEFKNSENDFSSRAPDPEVWKRKPKVTTTAV